MIGAGNLQLARAAYAPDRRGALRRAVQDTGKI
jgi:hypothetical protein